MKAKSIQKMKKVICALFERYDIMKSQICPISCNSNCYPIWGPSLKAICSNPRSRFLRDLSSFLTPGSRKSLGWKKNQGNRDAPWVFHSLLVIRTVWHGFLVTPGADPVFLCCFVCWCSTQGVTLSVHISFKSNTIFSSNVLSHSTKWHDPVDAKPK